MIPVTNWPGLSCSGHPPLPAPYLLNYIYLERYKVLVNGPSRNLCPTEKKSKGINKDLLKRFNCLLYSIYAFLSNTVSIGKMSINKSR